MFALSVRDILFMLAAVIFNGFAAVFMIFYLFGAAVGSSTGDILQYAMPFWITGGAIPLVVSYLGTCWVSLGAPSLKRGALLGLGVFILNAFLGWIVCKSGFADFFSDAHIFNIMLVSLILVPVGVISGAMIYGMKQGKTSAG